MMYDQECMIPPTLFGFVRGRSINCVNILVSTAKESIRMGETVMCVFLDVTDAFNKVNLDKLQVILTRLKVPNEYVNWINHCYRDRKVHVRIVGGIKTRNLRNDLPQGDGLSPLLFVLYTVGIHEHLI